MRKLLYIAYSAALLVMAIYLCSCLASGGSIDATDPILPAPELSEGTVNPETREITVTKDDITVVVQHWSRTRLNRKYTTVDMRSPFYYLETWEQTFQSEVFHVSITNNTPRNVVVVFDESVMVDEREYVYRPVLDLQDYKYRFSTKKLLDLKTKRGLQIAPQIILSHKMGGKPVPPGQTREGFMPYNTPSTQAATLSLTMVLEKEPEVATAAYEKVKFQFDFIQDLVLLKRQPAARR